MSIFKRLWYILGLCRDSGKMETTIMGYSYRSFGPAGGHSHRVV